MFRDNYYELYLEYHRMEQKEKSRAAEIRQMRYAGEVATLDWAVTACGVITGFELVGWGFLVWQLFGIPAWLSAVAILSVGSRIFLRNLMGLRE